MNSVGDDGQHLFCGWDDYRDMARARAGTLDMAVYQGRSLMLSQGEETEAILANPVTPNFFDFLGVKAALGRATVETMAGRPGAVLGDRLWHRRFGSDPQIVGKTIVLNGQAMVVNGVMPAQFTQPRARGGHGRLGGHGCLVRCAGPRRRRPGGTGSLSFWCG